MRLTEQHRPKTLSEIVGQPPARLLAAFAKEPYATCWLLTGSPGVGKTTAALALAHELGCDEGGDLDVICASELSVDSVREMLRTFSYKPMFGQWRLWVIEELETLHPQAQTLLKRGLETLPAHVVVVATSNDTTRLQPALVQRFCSLIFECRDTFAKAGNDRLAEIAAKHYPGVALPRGHERWGYDHAEEGRYSLRVALDRLQQWGLKHGEAHAHAVAGESKRIGGLLSAG